MAIPGSMSRNHPLPSSTRALVVREEFPATGESFSLAQNAVGAVEPAKAVRHLACPCAGTNHEQSLRSVWSDRHCNGVRFAVGGHRATHECGEDADGDRAIARR